MLRPTDLRESWAHSQKAARGDASALHSADTVTSPNLCMNTVYPLITAYDYVIR